MEKDLEHSQLIENLHSIKVIAIGPFTADELKKFDIQNTIANVHTIAGSVDVVVNELSLA
jgi:uroporphyrinogen-III synthase